MKYLKYFVGLFITVGVFAPITREEFEQTMSPALAPTSGQVEGATSELRITQDKAQEAAHRLRVIGKDLFEVLDNWAKLNYYIQKHVYPIDDDMVMGKDLSKQIQDLTKTIKEYLGQPGTEHIIRSYEYRGLAHRAQLQMKALVFRKLGKETIKPEDLMEYDTAFKNYNAKYGIHSPLGKYADIHYSEK